ncbi:membrane integrity-associated transporter subunit PqiC [Vibrio breoganii]|uniref:PqiC family protein n=1 Tax=Vibrio breoganii TaxID=553239 RepID=UPI000C850D44|nr:ABC-type transport auxiliary lipoprotein family protein [Vibrio breoganii]
MKKWICLFIALLVGCTSSDSIETKTYVLPNAEPEVKLAFNEVKVQMPSYLQGPGIVYRLSETEIKVASHNVWAGNLRSMLVEQIGQYQMPTTSDAFRLTIQFERFNGAYTGNAELKGTWVLGDKSGSFDIEQPLDKDGYDALVTALNLGLGDVMGQIKSQVEAP